MCIYLRSSLLCDVTRRRFIFADVSGRPIGSHILGSSSSRRILTLEDETGWVVLKRW
jgi:hypothetical protein